MSEDTRPRLSYRDAGVDIDLGNEAVARIKPWAARTSRPEVIAGVGGFAGAFGWNTPGVLLAGADGVGSKLVLAQNLQKFDTIGIDLVAMNVNDILAQGGEPMFFLDYIAAHQIDLDQIERLVAGMAQGCMAAGCALLGGETAELPDTYAPGFYDLAGFAVGRQVYTPLGAKRGDIVIGLESSGFHSNGFALVRRVLADSGQDVDAMFDEKHPKPLGEALLEPTRIYVRAVQSLWENVPVKAMAHITGGGLVDNIPRTLPPGLGARLERKKWPMPAVMTWLMGFGRVSDAEFLKTFNAGIGFTVVVGPEDARTVVDILAQHGIAGYSIGRIVEGQGVTWQ